MTQKLSSLEDYLNRQAGSTHALGRLLRHPDPEQGVVHTPREIAQQPLLWRHTARTMKKHAPALRRFLEAAGLYDPRAGANIILTGAGTSDYVGLSLADLLRMHFRVPCMNWPSTRITAFPGAFLMNDQRYLMVHFARSGNSPESRAVLELALKHYPDTARHVVITCNPDGQLARLAQAHPDRAYLITLHHACNDRALAMTSSFSNMVVAGQALAYLGEMDAFCALIERVALAGEYLIQTYSDDIFALADPRLTRAFYLGNNDLLGGATESALKAQELTVGMMTAKGEDTLAFRHGPISAVDANTLVCLFLSADPYAQRYEVDLLLQYGAAFRELGARTVVVGARPPAADLDESIQFIAYDPDDRWRIPTLHQVNPSVLFGQLFGLFASYRRGLNVDNPAVDKALYSHTVQGVHLYEYVGDGGSGALSPASENGAV